jgi:SH3-like domain-containing protein
VYRAAQSARTEYLEREITRLKADLTQAEEAMVTIESGLRGEHTRADAVSTVADARIEVERAARAAPWRRDDIQQARSKLEEAERQLRVGHSGSALFFASRAARIAQTLSDEAAQVALSRGSRFVHTSQANLRSGPSRRNRIVAVVPQATPVFPERHDGRWLLVRTPSGPVGWIHDSVLEAAPPGR